MTPTGKSLRLQRLLPVAAGLLLGLWHLGLRGYSLRLPMTSDEGEYAYQARLLSEGGVPYRDAYDQKPPMVFFLYRLAYALPGAHDRGSALPARLLAVSFSLATMLLLFLLTPGGWSPAARLFAPAAFAAMSAEPVGDLFTANTEVFLCAFLSLAALCLSRVRRAGENGADGWTLACGLSCGAALATKQTALWTTLAFAVLASFRPKGPGGTSPARPEAADPRRLALFTAGFLFIPALFAAYFAARGGLHDLLEQAWTRNMDYASLLLRPEAAARQLSWFLRTLLPLLLRGDWPFYLLAVGALAATQTRSGEGFPVLATLWLAASWVGVCTGLFLFPHYFLQAAPPLALCAALGIERFSLRSARLGTAAALFACLWPALAWGRIFFIEPPETAARRMLFPNPLYESAVLGEYLRTHSSPQDQAYVFGSEPQIYLHAGLSAATRHIYIYPLTLFPKGMGDIERELSALRLRKPRYIVFVDIPSSTLVASAAGERFRDGLRTLLKESYRLIAALPVLERGPSLLVPASRLRPADLGKESLILFELIDSRT